MGDSLKFVISRVNELLGKNYNLISFNDLNSDELLQILSDTLSKIQGDDESTKIDVRVENPEQTYIRIFSILRVLKYQPDKDPASFRQGLVKGERETIHPILKWLLSNLDLAKQRAYLARFLVKIEIPAEYLEDPELEALYEQYKSLVEDFKAVHKDREAGRKNTEATAELKSDLQAMEKEKEIVLSRIEKMKAKAAPGLHLLEAARSLRLEREKQRELILQKEQEQRAITTAQAALQRATRELQSLKQSGAGLTPELLLQRLTEDVTAHTAIARERLPAEIKQRETEVKALTLVVGSPYIGPEDVSTLRSRLDALTREVQTLVEAKASDANADKLALFRQQAAAVASMKRNVLGDLEKEESVLREMLHRLDENKARLKRLAAEEPAPQGEDLKRYVARLKAKSATYKECRGELAALKAEIGVLQRTQVILEARLDAAKSKDDDPTLSRKELPEDFTEETAKSMNAQLSRNVSTLRAQLAPLVNELQELRKKSQELEERYETANRRYKAVEESFGDSVTSLEAEVKSLKAEVTRDVEEKKRLQEEVSKMKLAEERILQEIKFYASPNSGPTLRDELNNAIASEEKKSALLKEEEKVVKETSARNETQATQWNNLIQLFACKLHHAEESRKRDGIVVRGEGAETLILQ